MLVEIPSPLVEAIWMSEISMRPICQTMSLLGIRMIQLAKVTVKRTTRGQKKAQVRSF